MNEQDIINRLARIEKMLEEIIQRLTPTIIVEPKPNNWPWPVTSGAIGPITMMNCDAPGANGGTKNE